MVAEGERVLMRSFVSRMVSAYPVRLAFVGSVLLSLIAVLGVVAIGRDAALYLDIVNQIGEHGLQMAWRFDWPWFLLLLAGTHAVTHVPLEWCAYLWSIAFMAGSCALLVDCVRQRVPDAAGWACLVVLAMPAINQFRYDIIREHGFWFFCSLALWLALSWQSRGGWLRVTCMHLAILAAILFRLEAAMLFAALGLWQLCQVCERRQWSRFIQFATLPLVGVLAGLTVLLVTGGGSLTRVDFFAGMLDPHRVFEAFEQLAKQFGDSLSLKYSRDDAGEIIFFGMLAVVLIKFVSMAGPFSLPFLHRNTWRAFGLYWREFQPFVWAALLYLVILMLFFVTRQFMISRYLSFLNVLAIPLLAVGLSIFAQRFPRVGKALMVVGILVMLSNVISTGAPKSHYVEAGQWISKNIDEQSSVYYEDGRISYYAGRGYPNPVMRKDAISDKQIAKYRYFAIEARADEPWLVKWLDTHHLRVLNSFENRKKATVLVIGPKSAE